jgi:hypothetical protein
MKKAHSVHAFRGTATIHQSGWLSEVVVVRTVVSGRLPGVVVSARLGPSHQV